MAVTKPLFINQVEYDAESERRGFAGLVAQASAGVPRSGVLGPAPAVSLSGSTVQVGAFNAVIGSSKGVYLVAVDSVTSAGSLGVADATNGRLDRVVLEVLDPDNGSGGTTRIGRLRIITGTPAALPGLPALPPLALHVAQIQVPKSGAGNPVVTVDAPLTAASGAPVPVRSQAERDALSVSDGFQVARQDLGGRVETRTAGTWRPLYEGPYAMASGSFTWPLSGPTTDLTGLALPDGRFTVPPLVIATSGSEQYGVSIASRSTSTTRWNARVSNGAAGVTVPINWIAIQMLPGSAQDIIL